MSKTRFFLIWMWTVWAVVVCLLVTSDVYAQSATSTDGGFQRMMNNIVRGTSGITNVSVGGGVSTTANGVVNVNAGVGRIPINTSATASISRAAIAKGAARVAVRALPWVATAVVINDIADAVKDSGIVTCPPPDFFCKKIDTAPDTGGFPNGPWEWLYRMTGGAGSGPSSTNAGEACRGYVALRASTPERDGIVVPYVYDGVSGNPGTIYCEYHSVAGNYGGLNWNETKFKALIGSVPRCIVNGESTGDTRLCPRYPANTPMPTVTPQQLEQSLEQKMLNDPNFALKMKQALDAVTSLNPAMEPVIDVKTAPLTVSAPPVTGPSTVVSTETLPNADGTTSTKQITQQVKVTPQTAQPSTVANPNTTFPSTTTQTTVVTNNNTNTSTTTTTIINNPAPAPEVPELELPTDYNREVTQKSILDILKSWSEPIKETLPDGNAEEQAIKAENDKGSTAINDITAAGVGIASWFPSVPTAPCVNPQVPMPLTGGTIAFPIGNYVDTFRLFITAVICFFCILGCKNQVQSALRV